MPSAEEVTAEETRTRLLQTMTHLMWTGSYAAASVGRVCKAAGANKGSFYHYFRSKEELALEALDKVWEMAKQDIFERAFHESIPPLDRFRRLEDLNYEFHRAQHGKAWDVEQGCIFENIGTEGGPENARLHAKSKEVFGYQREYMKTAVLDGIAAGSIPDQDADAATRRIIAFQGGLHIKAKIFNDVEWLRELFPGIRGILGAAAARTT